MPSDEQIKSNFFAPEIVQTAKPLVADETSVIQLHDLVVNELKRFITETENQNFPLDKEFSNRELLDRISRYEKSVSALCGLLALIAYWGREHHRVILQKVIGRSTDRLNQESGLHVWLGLRWYPIILQLYSFGVAAVDGGKYGCLNELLYTKIARSDFHNRELFFAEVVTRGLSEIQRHETFKRLPGYDRHYFPLNEYLLKTVQPMLDEVLFVGQGYERSFDEFEVLFSLIVADMNKQQQQSVWGPIGRFGWKQQNYTQAPFKRIICEAKTLQQRWPPLAAGLFGGDYQRFVGLVEDFEKIVGNRSFW